MGNFVVIPSFHRKINGSKVNLEQTSEGTQSNSSENENYHVYYDAAPDLESSLWTTIKNRRKHIPQTNRIRTTRYNVLTFLPKNIFHQFHRIANIYFAILIGINWVPVINAISKTVNQTCICFELVVNVLFRLLLYH
jgi:hypothetical protein